MNKNEHSPVKPGGRFGALAIGLTLLALGIGLCLLVTNPKSGHRLDVSSMPLEARKVFEETPGTPITEGQWKRIKQVLQRERWTSGNNLFALDIMASWYWFLLIPASAVALARVNRKAFSTSQLLLVVGPCLAFVASMWLLAL